MNKERQKSEGRRQKSEGRRQKSEVRRQKLEIRRQKAEVRGQKELIPMPIAQAFWQPKGSKGYNSPLNFFQWLVFRKSPNPLIKTTFGFFNRVLRWGSLPLGKWLCIALLVCLGLGYHPAPAQAHGFQTSYLELREQASGQVDVVWKTPSAMSFGDEGLSSPMTIRPVFPSYCTTVTVPKVMATPATRVTRWRLDCGKNGLAQATIAFPGLLQSSLEVLLRVEWADGHSQTTMVPTGEETFVIPEKTTVLAVGQTYLKLGVEHIFSGIDHLLFVLGLVLIVGPSWRLVKTITAFTLAHSITLGAATLGLVNVPQAPVEAVIALSILFLASELAHSRLGKPGLTEQYPWLVALTFGLLHGFGFAGALAEVGLPPQDIPPALLFFNVGVELGQLAFVLVVVAVMESLKRFGPEQYPRWLGWVPTYSIGILASFWCFQRVAAFWG